MRAAGRGQLVVLRFAAGVGESPLFVEQSLALEAVQGGVERALLDDDAVRGGLANPSADRIAVTRAPADGLEDENVERAGEQVGRPGSCVHPERCEGRMHETLFT